MTPSPGIEPGPHWWKASDLPLRQPCSPAVAQLCQHLVEDQLATVSLCVRDVMSGPSQHQTDPSVWQPGQTQNSYNKPLIFKLIFC